MYRDEEFRDQLLASISDEALNWMKEKSTEYLRLMAYYRSAMMEIETKFKVLKEEYSLYNDRNPINSIKTRLKSPKSIKEKLERLGYDSSVESVENNLNDVAGVRIICPFKDDVYTLAQALLNQDDVTLIKTKDYIQSPKENGYRSLHMIVSIPIYLAKEKREMKVEVQFRTIAMDSWASMEHQIVYKKGVEISEDMKKELSECANLSASLDEKMTELRRIINEQ